MTHEYTRQADKENQTGFQRHQELRPLPLGHLAPRKTKKGQQVVPLEGRFWGLCWFF